MLPSTLRPPSRRKMRRRRGTGTSSASHSVYAYLSFGPLPALALGTFLLCYALVLSCLLPMLAVMRDEPPVRGVRFSGLQGARIIGDTLYTLDGGDAETITLRIAADPANLKQVSSKIEFRARATDVDNLSTVSESRFLKPLE